MLLMSTAIYDNDRGNLNNFLNINEYNYARCVKKH